MLDGLAFLPTEKVKEGMTYLRSVMQCCRLLWLNLRHRCCKHHAVRQRSSSTTYIPSATWNVCAATSPRGDRTNRRLEQSLTALDRTRAPVHLATNWGATGRHCWSATKILSFLRHAVGNLSPKRQSKKTTAYQQRVRDQCGEFTAGRRSLRSRRARHSLHYFVTLKWHRCAVYWHLVWICGLKLKKTKFLTELR